MSTLSDELTNDPLGRGYSGMSDLAASVDLNTEYRTRTINVPIRELLVYLLKAGKMKPIDVAGNTPAHPAEQECYAFMSIMNNANFEDLDLSDATLRSMLINIRNAGLLDAADQTAILAMADEPVSRATELGLRRVRVGTVAAARSA